MPVINDIELKNFDTNSSSFESNREILKRNSSERSLPLRSYNKWSPAEQGATLVWRDLCVYMTGSNGSSMKNMKRIINNSTGAVQPGSLMALMGSRCVKLKNFAKII